jgi:GT2 family glycosyltransferase
MTYDVNSNYPSVTIGIPCLNGQMNVQTATSLIKIVTSLSFPRHLSFVKNTYLHIARKHIALEAQKFHTSHLFFLDNDMKVEGDVITKLLADKREIVGANYNQRKLPLTSTVRFKEKLVPKYDIGITPNQESVYRTAQQIPDALFECDAIGAGCMLIDMRVFDIIGKPWFFYGESNGNTIGEDVWFCAQAQKAGFKIWCDPTINVKHIGEYEY